MSTLKSSAEDLTLNADGSGNDVIIQSNASTKAIVTAEGTVGIGTTSPTVVDAGATGLHLHGDSDATNRVQLHLTSATTGASGTDGMYILYDGVTPQIQVREDQPLVFWLNGSERMRVLAAGGLTFNGDTAAANALDDYEEGTWTPVIKSGSNTITYSVSNSSNFKYTKIGDQVTVHFYLEGSTTSGTTGDNLTFEGLPFSSNAICTTIGSRIMTHAAGFVLDTVQVNIAIREGTTIAGAYKKTTVDGAYDVAHLDGVGAGAYVFWQLTYWV